MIHIVIYGIRQNKLDSQKLRSSQLIELSKLSTRRQLLLYQNGQKIGDGDMKIAGIIIHNGQRDKTYVLRMVMCVCMTSIITF